MCVYCVRNACRNRKTVEVKEERKRCNELFYNKPGVITRTARHKYVRLVGPFKIGFFLNDVLCKYIRILYITRGHFVHAYYNIIYITRAHICIVLFRPPLLYTNTLWYYIVQKMFLRTDVHHTAEANDFLRNVPPTGREEICTASVYVSSRPYTSPVTYIIPVL